MIEKKGVGLNPASQIHYTDHLAPICILMGIPLLFVEEADLRIGEHYYPGLKGELVDYQEFGPEYLISNYDVLFMSDLWDRKVFRKKYLPFERKYQKKLRNVHCPHGFSDKAFYLHKAANEDITLIYGQNMIDQFKVHDVFKNLHQYVITGNIRLTYYNMHRKFFDQIYEDEIKSRFIDDNLTILYAPTWLDLEESTTFFDCHQYVLENLPNNFNIVVKLHPRLELDDPVKYYQIMGQYEHKPNVLFLRDFPLVYPILANIDIYLGDISSIGYDFLTFNRPMFFLNKGDRDTKTDPGVYLFRCGVDIKSDQFSHLYNIISENLDDDSDKFSAIRKGVYDYTFGPEKEFQQIKKEIVEAYNKSEKSGRSGFKSSKN